MYMSGTIFSCELIHIQCFCECLWQQDSVNQTSVVAQSRFMSSAVQGMTEAEEDKLLALKDFMLKSNKAKANMGEQSHLGEVAQTGVIDLATLGITGRQVDLVKPKAEAEDKRGNPLYDSAFPVDLKEF